MYETTTRAQAIDFHHIRTTGEMSSIDMTIIVHAPVIAGLIGGTECPSARAVAHPITHCDVTEPDENINEKKQGGRNRSTNSDVTKPAER